MAATSEGRDGGDDEAEAVSANNKTLGEKQRNPKNVSINTF